MEQGRITEHLEFVEKMVSKGGPDETEYEMFKSWLDRVRDEWISGRLNDGDIKKIRAAFGDALSLKTNQGFALKKRHGYAGDFEVIDKIYGYEISKYPSLEKWDLYAHRLDGPVAVRNRKNYFLKLLYTLNQQYPEKKSINVLNVGSGPGRDLWEYFSINSSNNRILIDSIDQDKGAIEYSKELCKTYQSSLTFHLINIFKFQTTRRYQLIWSAGVFDYLDDRQFKFLLKRLLLFIDQNHGELVVGNFSEKNKARSYMEVMLDWFLHHRTPDQLRGLAIECGLKERDIKIGQEPKGVNLFLHIKRGKKFLDESSL